MKIVGSRWSSRANEIKLRCDCDEEFYHWANRWMVKCPVCGRVEHLQDLRERWFLDRVGSDDVD